MRSTKVIISKKNLQNNLNEIRKYYPDKKIIALVKANAYGHGIIGIAKLLEEYKVDYLGVAYIKEAILLRESGIKSEIIVLVPELNDVDLYFKYNLQPAVSTFEFLEKLENYGKSKSQKISIQVYADTGMSRDGFMLNQINSLSNILISYNFINLNGLFTHLSSSASDQEFSNYQISLFKKMIRIFNDNNIYFENYHFANSGAITNLEIDGFDIIRIGLALYGYHTTNSSKLMLDLKPILTLKSKVIMIREINAGDPVSYDRLYITKQNCKIATIPIGYGDGYSKLLTNKTHCLINGKKFPIVGAICMDECMVNIGFEDISIGDEVVLIGEMGTEKIDANDLAKIIGTIPYEITTSISSRVDRFYE